MVRGVRDPPPHHPCPRSLPIKEFRFRLPPNIIFRLQRREPLSAVLRITLHEIQPGLCRRKWRRVNVNSQHIDEPQILAHALMHHLFVHAAPSRVSLPRTHRKLFVAEFTPHAHHLHPLGLIGLNKKFVFHDRLLTRRTLRHHRFAAPPSSIRESFGKRPHLFRVSRLSGILPVDLRRLQEYFHCYARCSTAPSRCQRAYIRTSRRSRCRILSALFPKGTTRFRRRLPAKTPPVPSTSTSPSLAPRKSCACPGPEE